MTLADRLDRAICAMWPRRAQQERLLDLGERKDWTSNDRVQAVERVADWLVRELELPLERQAVTNSGNDAALLDDEALAIGRMLGLAAKLGAKEIGVAEWVCGVAPALGTAAKTFANSVGRPLRDERSDHRWLRLLARLTRGRSGREAWCFHGRHPKAMASALTSLGTSPFDAADALIVLSLLALWQRRRPTDQAKGNRGRIRRRRETPKPIAGLMGSIAQPAQCHDLVKLAGHLESQPGRFLAELAIEAALTEAHLGAHPARLNAVIDSSSEPWLEAAKASLVAAPALLHAEDRAVFAFRIARLQAWAERGPQPVDDGELLRHPYVAACVALEQERLQPGSSGRRFVADTPGLLMHLPALRAKGLLETS